MRRRVWVLAVAMAAAAWRPAAAEVPILPLDQVKEGMQGHGLTVFKGTDIEKFDCTVLGVLRAFDFQMDMILIRIDSGPVVTKKYGVVAGMSGSPIYIGGKLVGALAYGWSFQNEPIAGVTPIEQMLTHYDPQHPVARAARDRRQQKIAAGDESGWPTGSLRPQGGSVSVSGRRIEEIHVAATAHDARQMAKVRPDLGVLAPVATPLMVSGLPAGALGSLTRMLEPYNLVPMQAGAAKAPANAAVDFSPGAAIGVQVVDGDVQLTAIGTMTYREGNTILGFGHPFFALGGIDMPMTTAYITTVINSAYTSNKMGGALSRVGKISQDRMTCIGGRFGETSEMLPMRFRLGDKQRGADVDFRLQLVRQPMLTEMLSAMMLNGAMTHIAGRMFDGVTNSRLEVECREGKDGPLRKVVRENSFDTKAARGMGFNPLMDLLMTLTMLRQNPFGEATVQNVDLSVEFEADRRLAGIQRAQTRKQVVKPGETVELTAYVKPYGGQPRPLPVAVKVPDNAPLGPLLVVLMGGNESFALRPRINPEPMPRDVPSLIAWLNNKARQDCILVEMVTSSLGLEFCGRVLPDLPLPVAEALVTSNAEGMLPRPDVVERIVPTSSVIAGAAAVMLEVVGEDGQRAKEGGGPQRGQNQFERPMSFGRDDPEFMGPMDMAVRRAYARLFGDEALTSELGWLPTSDTRSAIDALLRRLVDGAHSQWRPLPRPRQTGKPDAARPDKPDKPEPGKGGPPDVSDALDLKKPPRLPGYKELEDVGKGKLDGKDEPPGKDDKGAKDEEEDDDGEPIARPLQTWTVAKAEDFAKGRCEGTCSDTDGSVSLAPVAGVVGRPEVERVWAVLPRPDGSVVLGSWSAKAKLLRQAPDGKVETLLEAEDAGLPALTALPDGAVVAGGVPSGRLYRVTGPGKSSVLATLEAPYVWALESDGKGGVYAATGNGGRVYHVDAKGTRRLALQTSDRHVMSLAVAPDGALYAGTYPEGKVYRVKGDEVRTVFQTDDGPALGLAATANGRLYVGTGEGKLFRVEIDGESKELATIEDSAVYALRAVGNSVFAAVSHPGRLVRVDEADVQSQVYRTEEPYLLGLGADAKDLYTAVAASGEVVKVGVNGGDRGTYVSEAHDCEMTARWVLARWQQTVTGRGVVTLQTRTGNTATPDRAWSGWSEESVLASGAAITSPPGRFIQFRARFYGKPGDQARLDRVDLLYRTLNRAPVVKAKEPEAGGVAKGKYKVKWEAEDPDDDELTYEVFYAKAGSDEWTKIEPPKEEEPKEGAEEGTDEPVVDDTKTTPDKTAPDKATPNKPAAPKDKLTPEKPPKRDGAKPVASWRNLWGLALASEEPPKAKPSAPKSEDSKTGAPKAKPSKSSDGDKEAKKASKDEPLTESDLEWDTAKVPDGWYILKVVATDAKRNPDDPKTKEVRYKPFRVDNTKPYATFEVKDEARPLPATLRFGEDMTWLESAEYRFDDGKWAAWLPTDGLFGERFETFKVPTAPTEPGDHVLSVRVRDAGGNVLKVQWKFTVAAPAAPTAPTAPATPATPERK